MIASWVNAAHLALKVKVQKLQVELSISKFQGSCSCFCSRRIVGGSEEAMNDGNREWEMLHSYAVVSSCC